MASPIFFAKSTTVCLSSFFFSNPRLPSMPSSCPLFPFSIPFKICSCYKYFVCLVFEYFQLFHLGPALPLTFSHTCTSLAANMLLLICNVTPPKSIFFLNHITILSLISSSVIKFCLHSPSLNAILTLFISFSIP